MGICGGGGARGGLRTVGGGEKSCLLFPPLGVVGGESGSGVTIGVMGESEVVE